MSGCVACGRRLYFSERVAWPQEFCFPCACLRGITRIADQSLLHSLRNHASELPMWWRWTVFLRHALRWNDAIQRKLGRDTPRTVRPTR